MSATISAMKNSYFLIALKKTNKEPGHENHGYNHRDASHVI